MIAEYSIVADSSDAKEAKSGKLGRTSGKRRQVGRKVERVGMQSVLEIEGERVKELRYKIQTPEGDFGREKRREVVIRSE